MLKIVAEYIWLDSKYELRSKTKIIYKKKDENVETWITRNPEDYPVWNFDGSSTAQSEGIHSELFIRPVAIYTNPFFTKENGKDSLDFVLVLCETLDKDFQPLPTNHYQKAIEIFNKKIGLHPWFGIEQEYFLVNEEDIMILSEGGIQQGEFYCSTGCNRAIHRDVAVEHMLRCMDADLNISGINAEVAPCQWEYQIGPCSGIDAANQLWVSRWILIRTAEKYNLHVDFSPKPFEGVNGSGCHTNVSTVSMREEDSGLDYIFNAIKKLSVKHKEHMKIYGANNDKRMSGKYETSNYNIFSFDKDKPVNRGASIRIGYDTMKNKKGYFEDRRPASNMDPYQVTSAIFNTIIS